MVGLDERKRKIQAETAKSILRLPKTEPFKMWLAQVGSERLDEIAAPEKAIERASDNKNRPTERQGD